MLEVVAAIIDVSFAKGFKMNFLLCKSATMIFFAKLEVAGRRLFIATNLLMKISFMPATSTQNSISQYLH